MLTGRQERYIETIRKNAGLILTLTDSKFSTPTGFEPGDFDSLMEVKNFRDEVLEIAVQLLRDCEDLNDSFITG